MPDSPIEKKYEPASCKAVSYDENLASFERPFSEERKRGKRKSESKSLQKIFQEFMNRMGLRNLIKQLIQLVVNYYPFLHFNEAVKP